MPEMVISITSCKKVKIKRLLKLFCFSSYAQTVELGKYRERELYSDRGLVVDRFLWTVNYYIFRQMTEVRGTSQRISSVQRTEDVCIVHGVDALCL
jgi:hypothetical protein